jgi:hypothetical protein
MTAWSPPKVNAFRHQFGQFLNNVTINSKDFGPIILGENILEAQERYFSAVFDALQHDVHDIKHLKSRQLGISTASRAFLLFWIGMFDGLKGYMILDTGEHKEEARLELIDMVDNIPKSFGFPSRDKSEGGASNRSILKLSNQSTIIFAAAGTRDTKSGGVLGRGSGVNFLWASEMCSWSNVEGLESFRNSLSQVFENRLYLWESTGRGYNQWWDMWNEAKKDPHHQKCHFTGWWGHNLQRIARDHPDFHRYGFNDPSTEEKERCKEVLDRYGWTITREQLAWWRRHIDPSVNEKDEAGRIIEASSLQLIEQPWTEDDAFASSSAVFFNPKELTEIGKKHASNKYKAYTYYCGYDFLNMKVAPAINQRSIHLKVWEEPDPDGIYVVACDPAYGENEKNDRSSIQVLRCYADGLDQVAEYCWPLITTDQLSWVIAHLLGWYDNCYFILELNGPGDAVWRSIKSLKKEVTRGVLNGVPLKDGFDNIFSNVKNFVYQRSDTMIAGRALQMKTSGSLKVTIMEKLRDFVSNGMLAVRSVPALDEMKAIAREGDRIQGSGAAKDDRVLALAFGVHYWNDKIRVGLSGQKLTRDSVVAKRRLSITDMASMFTTYQIKDFFDRKQDAQNKLRNAAARRNWRGR